MVQIPVRKVLETFCLILNAQNAYRASQLNLHKRFQLKVQFNTNKTKFTLQLTQTKIACLKVQA